MTVPPAWMEGRIAFSAWMVLAALATVLAGKRVLTAVVKGIRRASFAVERGRPIAMYVWMVLATFATVLVRKRVYCAVERANGWAKLVTSAAAMAGMSALVATEPGSAPTAVVWGMRRAPFAMGRERPTALCVSTVGMNALAAAELGNAPTALVWGMRYAPFAMGRGGKRAHFVMARAGNFA